MFDNASTIPDTASPERPSASPNFGEGQGSRCDRGRRRRLLRPSSARTLAADEQTLFRRVRDDSDTAARDELVKRFLPLAHRLARRYARSSEPYDDLFQVASLALLKAIERYDPRQEASFNAFATPTISGELKRYFRDAGWSVHVTRGAKEGALAIERARSQLTNAHGRAPTVQQLADHLGKSCEQVLDGLLASGAYRTRSLDAPQPGHDDQGATTLGETIGAEDRRYELIDSDVSVAGVMKFLQPRERAVLRLRFLGEQTQNEIAAELQISQMQVSRLLRRALTRLREMVEEDEPGQGARRTAGHLAHAGAERRD